MPAALLPLLLACHEREDPGFDVLLVSIDGTPPALLDEEWESLGVIPTLGEHRFDLQVPGVTDTMASHAKLLTGYGEDVTGVTSAFHWEAIPKGLSLQERVKQKYGPNMRAYWVANKAHMLGFESNDQPFYHAATACDFASDREMIADITPDMLDALRSTGDLPFFAFFHWGGVDQAGHEHGERSAEQRAALHDVDAQLGVIRDELQALDRLERTRIYVTTDHGFDPGGTKHYTDAADVFLLTNDPAVGPGEWNQQLAWTLLDAWGIAVDDPAPPMAPL